jgi:hypothetical protein
MLASVGLSTSLDTVALVAGASGQYSLAGMLEFNSKVQHNPNH